MNSSPTPKLPWTPKTVRARLFGDGELGAGDDCLPGALVFVQRLDGGLVDHDLPTLVEFGRVAGDHFRVRPWSSRIVTRVVG